MLPVQVTLVDEFHVKEHLLEVITMFCGKITSVPVAAFVIQGCANTPPAQSREDNKHAVTFFADFFIENPPFVGF